MKGKAPLPEVLLTAAIYSSFLSAILFFILSSGVASADESLFANSYGADTQPAGAGEIALWDLFRWDKGRGKYQAHEIQLEVERGITPKFQVAGYLLFLALDYDNAWPKTATGEDQYPASKHSFDFQGAKAALKYNFLSPYTDSFGLSVAFEPLFARKFRIDGKTTEQYEFENKLILQKDFFEDQLVLVYNLGIETEVRTFPGSADAENEVVITHSGGASYRFIPNWFAGIEFKDVRDILNGKKNNNAFFAGPNLHFAQKNWYVTVSYMRQLMGGPPYAYSTEPGAPSGNYNYEERDQNELRFKLGWNLL